MLPTRTYNFWVLAYPAPDLPGQWIGHCLDIDVVSHGASLEHAVRMTLEAAMIVVLDDAGQGRDPLERRAPSEEWEPLWKLLSEGTKIDARELVNAPAEVDGAAVQVVITTFALDPAAADTWKRVPAAWAHRRKSHDVHV